MEFLNKLKSQNKAVLILAAVAAVMVIASITVVAVSLDRSQDSSTQVNVAGVTAVEGDSDPERQAREIALNHAGVQEQEVQSLQTSKERDDGKEIYEIRFQSGDRSYFYRIQSSSGEILTYSYDAVQTASQSDGSAASDSAAADSNAASSSSGNAASGGGTSSAITRDQAKSIALQHAGVQESDTAFVWIKEDTDDGRAVYDVEFVAGSTEYDYEIDRNSGDVLSFDQDIENYTPSTSGGAVISMEQARDLALARVSGATANDIRIEQEHDDGRIIYEGEIYYDRMEYEFEIDATTGTFIQWSEDYWD